LPLPSVTDLFSTVITLVLVPSFYYIAEDIKIRTSRLLAGIGMTMDPRLYIPDSDGGAKAEEPPAGQVPQKKPAAKRAKKGGA